MRCENCPYCNYDSWDGFWYCQFHFDYTEDRNGDCGCKYNKRTLDKKLRGQQEQLSKIEEEE